MAAHIERRHPAELARSCGSMPRWGIDCCATPQRRPLQINRKVAIKASPLGGVKTPPYSTNGQGSVGANNVRPCNLAAAQDSAGEQCSPLQPPQSLPCVKGDSPQCGEMSRSDRGARRVSGWHGVSRDGGIGACMGVLGCTRKVAIPQSALPRSQPTLHKGAILYPHRVSFGPGGANRREVKKREETRSTPAFFSFFTSRPPLWGSQGAGPGGRGLRVAHERARFAGWRRSLCAAKRALSEVAGTFFASFLGVQKGRPNGYSPL